MILALTRSMGIFDSFAPDPVTRLYYCKESLMCLNNYVLWVKLSVHYLCFFFMSVSLRVFQIMNNDNEPPSLVQFSRNTDEKLTINKCWPNCGHVLHASHINISHLGGQRSSNA